LLQHELEDKQNPPVATQQIPFVQPALLSQQSLPDEHAC
jgi:hypothetical protein